MNSDLRNELLLILANENVDEDDQIRIMVNCTKFINHIEYMKQVKEKFSNYLTNKENEDNFYVILPKLIGVLVELNKNVDTKLAVPSNQMKFVIYAIIFSVLDDMGLIGHKLNEGDLRVAYSHISELMLLDPFNLNINTETCWASCWDYFSDESKIHI